MAGFEVTPEGRQSQVINYCKDFFPKPERRVPRFFSWHPDQKLPGFRPQIAQRSPIRRLTRRLANANRLVPPYPNVSKVEFERREPAGQLSSLVGISDGIAHNSSFVQHVVAPFVRVPMNPGAGAFRKE
jgi:hypothetical protein